MATRNVYYCNSLTGGVEGSLDDIDCTSMPNGSTAVVNDGSKVYDYTYDSSSSAAESSPTVIKPDTGVGRWILSNKTSIIQVDSGDAYLRIQSGDNYVDHNINTEYDIKYHKATSTATMDFTAYADDGTSVAQYRFGVGQTSTGSQRLQLYDKPNLALNAQIADSSSTTYFCLYGGRVGIGLDPPSTMPGLSVEAGLLTLKERTTPTANANYGKIYTKTDNKLYFQDGAGTEHELVRRLTNTAVLDFGSTATQTSTDLTITVTGAVVGDTVSLGLPASPDANGCFTAWVSAADTVTVRFNNYSSGAIDPASATYRVDVIKN